MYCKLLDEAVRELKGEKIEEDFETLIEIKINAYIPNSYISSEFQKLEMYKKISLINNENDYYDVQTSFWIDMEIYLELYKIFWILLL